MRAMLTQLAHLESLDSQIEFSALGKTGITRSCRTATTYAVQARLFPSEHSRTAWVMLRLAADDELARLHQSLADEGLDMDAGGAGRALYETQADEVWGRYFPEGDGLLEPYLLPLPATPLV